MTCKTCGNRIFELPKFTIHDQEIDELLNFCSKKCVKIYAVRKL